MMWLVNYFRSYLKEKPTHTKADFIKLKAISDELYHSEDWTDSRYGSRNLSIHALKVFEHLLKEVN